MKKKALFLIGGLFITTAMTFAQETVYVVNKGSRFFRTPPSERTEVQHMNVVKFDLLNQLRGEMKFSYEHVIGDKSSFEVTLGPNVSNLYNGRFSSQYGGERSKLGVSAELGFKYYPLRDLAALNQFYVMPAIGVKHFNTEYVPGTLNNVGSTEPYNGFTSRLYYTFNVGYQHWVSETFSIDYFVGLGLANVTEDFANTTYNYDPNTGMSTIDWEPMRYSFPTVQVNAGIKFGIGWSAL